MKILFLCTDDFPNTGACTSLLRNIFFEGELSKKISRIDILTRTPYLPKTFYEIYNGIGIYHFPYWKYINLSVIRQYAITHPIKAIQGILSKIRYKFDEKILKEDFLSNEAVKSYLHMLKVINKSNNYDVIIAVSGIFVTAQALVNFKKELPKTKFVLYQVDPLSTNYSYLNLSGRSRKKLFQLEQDMYSLANAIILTPIVATEIEKKYNGKFHQKIFELEFPNVSLKRKGCIVSMVNRNVPCECVFTGNIYGGIRNPEFTFRLFTALSNDKVNFSVVGNTDVFYLKQYPKIHFMGHQNLDETRRIIDKSDFLVNIGNTVLNQVPSKLFEYISTGKPIINICKSKQCPTLPYMQEYPLCINIFEEDPIEIQIPAIKRFIMASRGKLVSQNEIARLYKECTPMFCAKKMYGIFQALMGTQ